STPRSPHFAQRQPSRSCPRRTTASAWALRRAKSTGCSRGSCQQSSASRLRPQYSPSGSLALGRNVSVCPAPAQAGTSLAAGTSERLGLEMVAAYSSAPHAARLVAALQRVAGTRRAEAVGLGPGHDDGDVVVASVAERQVDEGEARLGRVREVAEHL